MFHKIILKTRSPAVARITNCSSCQWPSRSSKVDDFPVIWKPVCDFLLVINSNLGRLAPFSHNTSVTDGETDGRMDGRTTTMTTALPLLKYGRLIKVAWFFKTLCMIGSYNCVVVCVWLLANGQCQRAVNDSSSYQHHWHFTRPVEATTCRPVSWPWPRDRSSVRRKSRSTGITWSTVMVTGPDVLTWCMFQGCKNLFYKSPAPWVFGFYWVLGFLGFCHKAWLGFGIFMCYQLVDSCDFLPLQEKYTNIY